MHPPRAQRNVVINFLVDNEGTLGGGRVPWEEVKEKGPNDGASVWRNAGSDDMCSDVRFGLGCETAFVVEVRAPFGESKRLLLCLRCCRSRFLNFFFITTVSLSQQ